MLTTSDRRKLCLIVIPAGMSESQGQAALEASVTPYFAASPKLLLAKIAEEVDPEYSPAEATDS